MSDVLRPGDHLRMHWRQAKADFWQQWHACFESGANHTQLMLILGTIRSLYWQSLGQGQLAIARTIGNWWAKVASLHQLGKVI